MFITFEGIDASGKSSVIKALKEHIEQNYDIKNFIFTREPGGNNLKSAEKIRELILDNENEIDSLSEALLYLASRCLHVNKVIKPALVANKIVICDRFIDSSIAYQGNARKLGMDKIEKLNLMIVENTLPKYTFYLKIDAQTSFNRLLNQNNNLDRLENEEQDFFKKAIEGYDFLAKRDYQRYIVIDATKPIEKVIYEVINKFDKILKDLS